MRALALNGSRSSSRGVTTQTLSGGSAFVVVVPVAVWDKTAFRCSLDYQSICRLRLRPGGGFIFPCAGASLGLGSCKVSNDPKTAYLPSAWRQTTALGFSFGFEALVSLGLSSPPPGNSGAATLATASTARLTIPFPAFWAAVVLRRADFTAVRTVFLIAAVLPTPYVTLRWSHVRAARNCEFQPSLKKQGKAWPFHCKTYTYPSLY
jgi:hypothetical protein